MMEEDVRALLKTAPSLSALGGRIDWDIRAVGRPLPAAVLTLVADATGIAYDGPDTLEITSVQLDIWAKTAEEVILLRRAVGAVVNGYKSGNIRGIFLDGVRSATDDSGAETVYGRSLDLRVCYRMA